MCIWHGDDCFGVRRPHGQGLYWTLVSCPWVLSGIDLGSITSNSSGYIVRAYSPYCRCCPAGRGALTSSHGGWYFYQGPWLAITTVHFSLALRNSDMVLTVVIRLYFMAISMYNQ